MQHDLDPAAAFRLTEPKPDMAKRMAAGLDMPSDVTANGKVLRPDRVGAWDEMPGRASALHRLH